MFSPIMYEWSSFSTPSSAVTVIIISLYFSHCDSYIVIFHGFNLHFPNWKWCTSFQKLICHLYNLFSKMFLLSFWPSSIGLFAFSLFSLESLYILYTSPLSDMWSANIFSQSVSCIFILLTGSSREQKFLILI